MATIVYGLGGHCFDCNNEHDHPMNNILEIIEDESDA